MYARLQIFQFALVLRTHFLKRGLVDFKSRRFHVVKHGYERQLHLAVERCESLFLQFPPQLVVNNLQRMSARLFRNAVFGAYGVEFFVPAREVGKIFNDRHVLEIGFERRPQTVESVHQFFEVESNDLPFG